jgi:hypothetical protein
MKTTTITAATLVCLLATACENMSNQQQRALSGGAIGAAGKCGGRRADRRLAGHRRADRRCRRCRRGRPDLLVLQVQTLGHAMLSWTSRALLACLTLGLAAPALADPQPWGVAQVLRERYHRPTDGGDDVRVVYMPNPRMATADTMDGEPQALVARGLPWGFNRGTCDRERIPAQGEALAVGMTIEGSDRDCVLGALEMLPDQRQIAWTGEAGEIFRVSTERTFRSQDLLCRDYTAQIQIDGQKQQTIGTACRRPDGQWEVRD